jgi:hypothetical protein
MGLIPTDEKFNKSQELAELVDALFESQGIKIPIPNPFTIIASKIRPGMNALATAASVKSRFNEIGLPEGTLEGGATNVMENYTDVITEEIVSMLQDDARIDVALSPGAIQTTGGNAAGAVVGVNPAPVGNANGLMA